MRLFLCILTASQAVIDDAIENAASRMTEEVDLVVFGNGCELELKQGKFASLSCSTIEKNRGVPFGLHRLYMQAKVYSADPNDILCYIHDDLRILEHGWDVRVKRAFIDHPDCGLVGFQGSTALGGDEIYQVPYEIHQLGRRNFYGNDVSAEAHGERVTQEMPIVSVDGLSMVVRRSLLDQIGGWSWWPTELVHHGYDYGIACQNRRHGYSAWLVPIACQHRGGMTACAPVHQEMAKEFGGDVAVHAASHEFVYEHFRDVLPLRLR